MRKNVVLITVLCVVVMSACKTEVTRVIPIIETKTIEQKIEQPVYSTGLEISSLPSILNYSTNDVLDLTGLVVKMNKTNGSQVTLSESEYTVMPANGCVLTDEGSQVVKITAEGRVAYFVITVTKEEIPSEPEIHSVGLEIASLPNTLNYLPNQNLDLSGLVIKKNMSDGTCVTLSDDEYTTEPENGILLSEIGTMPIKIISDNKIIFFTINVSETILTGIEITSMPTKIDYEDGEVFISEGLGISAVYSTNSSTTNNPLAEEQYKLNIEDGASLESGKDFKVVVSYYNKTAFFIIHVGAKTFESYEFLDDGSHVLPAICKENENLKRVVIPESIQEIYEYAFDGCTNLESISLPTSLNKIGTYAFRNCAKLTELSFPDSISIIYDYAFEGCGFTEIQLPQSLIKLLRGTFRNCESLEKVKLNDSLNLIARESFYNCKALKEIVWSNSVEIVGLAAFYNCSSLEELILPSSLKEIHVNFAEYGYVKDFISKLSYEGSIEEFNTILINGNYLQGTTIYCSDGSFVYGEE